MQGKISKRKIVSLEPLLTDHEIEKISYKNNSATRRRRALAQQAALHLSSSNNLHTTSVSLDSSPEEEMAENPYSLEDYVVFTGPINFNSIARPTINATNMEIKPTLIHLV